MRIIQRLEGKMAMTGNMESRSWTSKLAPWAVALTIGVAAGSLVQGADDYDEDIVTLDPSIVAELNKAVGGRSVNFILTFVEEGGAIIPAAAGKELVPSPVPPDIQGKPTRVILFVDENDQICIQKPDGSWYCAASS
jgi:hypothetical protein